METVILSPEFQVVIPRAIREALRLTAGEKLHVMRYADRVEFIPVRSVRQMRGFLRGMDTAITREDDPWQYVRPPFSPTPNPLETPPGARHNALYPILSP